jgi:ArsR family transcriptional regulator
MSTNVMDAPAQGLFLSDELEHELLGIFKLLSDETRLRILLYLGRERELHVTALCTRLDQSQPAVSHHLALLREADLIEARREGKHNFYSLKRGHFHSVIERLFESIADPQRAEIRFDEFVLLHGSEDGIEGV